ncbi:hypothetical protein [Sorangium sp. So ce117]|uniref:hypothetical protein n=1 Tax=Sorangium sp. So ce117 TaxID=3133277 RepID=UPI003F609206
MNAPMKIAGCELPAGGGVFAQIIWAHHDPAVFPESAVFRPEASPPRSGAASARPRRSPSPRPTSPP